VLRTRPVRLVGRRTLRGIVVATRSPAASHKRKGIDAPTAPGSLPLDQVLEGDSVQLLAGFPEASIDMVFADPPYNLQLSQDLWRPNQTRVDGVDEAWDRFADFADYDGFTRSWLLACRRVLKPTGSLWVIGTYHNIYRVGAILQDLGFWILNDVVWIKTNPMPNFRGVRFTNAHETLIWASTSRRARYFFNHKAMRAWNDDLQMRSDWVLPVCNGAERLRAESGARSHPTQKPEALLTRVLLASSRPGNVILDPFFGTGTTGVVAKRLRRHWIGIEQQASYVAVARERLARTAPSADEPELFEADPPHRARVSVGELIASRRLSVGQSLFFRKDRRRRARLRADGRLRLGEEVGSIHQLGRMLSNGSPCNGWDHWYFTDSSGQLLPIDDLRQDYLRSLKAQPPAGESGEDGQA